MTVKELIAELSEIADKSLKIEISYRDGWGDTYNDPYIEIEERGGHSSHHEKVVVIK